jgi:phosphoserine aminotransferase
MVHNFNAGPAALPTAVLARAQAELTDYRGRGLSILEMSHRSKEYEAVNAAVEARLRELLGLPANYRVALMQGGASAQFALLALNLLPAGRSADYLVTGSWGAKALDEAKIVGTARAAADTGADGCRSLPTAFELDADAAYLHLTTNETIQGVQWPAELPALGPAPLIADMSSDFLSRPFDVTRYAMIYAGAQKNIGPAGVTAVILRDDLLAAARKDLPVILRYQTAVKNQSLYNTPPVYAVYMVGLVLDWIVEQGGLPAIAALNAAKAALLYEAIDLSGGFYHGHADAAARSQMNVTFRLADAALEQAFLAGAEAAGMIGLPGHRSVGGIRASIYNAVPLASVQALAQYMTEFARSHG